MVVTFSNLKDNEFYALFLELINNAIKHDDRKISDTEKQMLAMFMSLPEKYDHKRFSRVAKKKIREGAKNDYDGVLTNLNINNKIYSLVNKGYLRRDEDGVIYLNDKLESLIKQRRDVNINSDKENKINLVFSFTWNKEIQTIQSVSL